MAKVIPCVVCGLPIIVPNVNPQDLVGVIHCPRCKGDPIPYIPDDWDEIEPIETEDEDDICEEEEG